MHNNENPIELLKIALQNNYAAGDVKVLQNEANVNQKDFEKMHSEYNGKFKYNSIIKEF